MDQNERRIIDDLFEKLGRVEKDAPPRDPEAEALIRRHLGSQPGAPYYMAQAIVVQEQALANAQARVQELERKVAGRPSGGGILSGLFGGGEESTRPERGPARGPAGYPGAYRSSGGGFLAGAMQTALGVAGGVLIADAIASAFAPEEAAAAEAPPEEAPSEEWAAQDDSWGASDMPDDGGFDTGEF
jgi:uncharacterized protein